MSRARAFTSQQLAASGFHRWANRLRRGGLYRHGDEGTSGERCAFLEGGALFCKLCGAAPKRETDAECLREGHPAWYCSRVVEKIGTCREPGRVRRMNVRSAAMFIGYCVLAAVALLGLLVSVS